MQLGRTRHALAGLVAFASGVFAAAPARADVVTVDTTHTVYHEAPTRTNMTVYTPGIDVSAIPFEWLTVKGGYDADIVSGASVSAKAGPTYQATHPGADVISTASVRDLRHAPRGSLVIGKGDTRLTTGYAYSTENDYRSHTLSVGARTDAYEHNTQFEISYARNFDSVCDRVQGPNDPPPRRRALEDSTGCFTSDPLRKENDVAIDGFQGSWTQAWTPILATQLVYTAQILNGFQSNPYRSVILGEGLKAQEHHPENRARHAITARVNLFLRPLKTALRLSVRGYRDSWDINSATVELEAERAFGEAFRFGVRARGYGQTAALFFSDDYTGGDPPLGPKGQYFTGDRELSPFKSLALGVRAKYILFPEQGRLLGALTQFRVGASFDVVQFDYTDFTLAGSTIGNARALIGALSAGASF